jgi:hypothetical protein
MLAWYSQPVGKGDAAMADRVVEVVRWVLLPATLLLTLSIFGLGMLWSIIEQAGERG